MKIRLVCTLNIRSWLQVIMEFKLWREKILCSHSVLLARIQIIFHMTMPQLILLGEKSVRTPITYATSALYPLLVIFACMLYWPKEQMIKYVTFVVKRVIIIFFLPRINYQHVGWDAIIFENWSQDVILDKHKHLFCWRTGDQPSTHARNHPLRGILAYTVVLWTIVLADVVYKIAITAVYG